MTARPSLKWDGLVNPHRSNGDPSIEATEATTHRARMGDDDYQLYVVIDIQLYSSEYIAGKYRTGERNFASGTQVEISYVARSRELDVSHDSVDRNDRWYAVGSDHHTMMQIGWMGRTPVRRKLRQDVGRRSTFGGQVKKRISVASYIEISCG
jgi:hypothetical protein